MLFHLPSCSSISLPPSPPSNADVPLLGLSSQPGGRRPKIPAQDRVTHGSLLRRKNNGRLEKVEGLFRAHSLLGGHPSSRHQRCKCMSVGGEQSGRDEAWKLDKEISAAATETRRHVKVIGLGTKAIGILHFCVESALLSFAEFWTASTDGMAVKLQPFEVLRGSCEDVGDGTSVDESGCFRTNVDNEIPGAVFLVVGAGAGGGVEAAMKILELKGLQGGLAVSVVMQPFNFEGPRRRKEVEDLIGNLLDCTDLIFVVEHDALLTREKLTLEEASRLANTTVLLAIKAICDLVSGDQDKVLDIPLEGVKDINDSELFAILGHAGNAWVGFGAGCNMKAAIHQAAFGSPFLHSLVPGIKGVVACIIAMSESMTKQELQAAVRSIRCIIGPRAQLLCTSIEEPLLEKRVILVTIIVTRIDKKGASSVPKKQRGRLPELSSPSSLSGSRFNQISGSMMKGILRRSNEGPCQEKQRSSASISSFKANVQETKQHKPQESLAELNVCQSKIHDAISSLAMSSSSVVRIFDAKDCRLDQVNVSHVYKGTTELVGTELEGTKVIQISPEPSVEETNAAQGNNAKRKVMHTESSKNYQEATIESHDSASVVVRNSPEINVPSLNVQTSCSFLAKEKLSSESGLKMGSVTASTDGSKKIVTRHQDSMDTRAQSVSGQDCIITTGKEQDLTIESAAPLAENKRIGNHLVSSRQKFSFTKQKIKRLHFSVSVQKNVSMVVGKGNCVSWESGPNSAAAEAWAQTRLEARKLGASDKNEHCKVPTGVRPKGGQQLEANASNRLGNALSSDSVMPFTRVVNDGLGVMLDIYNATSAMMSGKDVTDEDDQASLSLSQRAASMLESERSSGKLKPLVEMNYKNGVYKGRCEGGLPEGKGRLTYADGSFYDGLWKQGKRAGAGTFYYANGDMFQGYWRDDQMHGKGWIYFHTGERLYADFWKGKINGEGRYYSAEGDVFFGNFKENWRHGDGIFVESGGIRWCETWNNGILVSRTQMEGFETS